MSAGTQVVLLDSSAYFRLANSVRPLLRQEFGAAPGYTLYVLAELDDEFSTSTRLRTKFEWVAQKEYREDRAAKRYAPREGDRTRAATAFGFLAAYADGEGIDLSREDLRALAVGFVNGIPVVTDDRGMQRVAEAHAIECWNSIKLLRVMENAGRIDREKVAEILEYWDYENDLPMPKARLREVFREYFGWDCPL
jgi:hypothetical protein